MSKLTTADCKRHLVDFFQAQGTSCKEAEWKRGKKSKDGQDTVREFAHPTLGFYSITERDGQLLQPVAIGDDRVQEIAAKALITRMLYGRDGTGEDDESNALDESEESDDPIAEALANGSIKPEAIAGQFVFGVATDNDDGKFDLYAIITPKVYWEREGLWYDAELGLDPLLPEGSSDMNGCGTWYIHGASTDPVAFRDELVARGFVWTSDFQRSVNEQYDGQSVEEMGWDPRVLEATQSAKPRP